jgi:hypothetical protein
MKRYLKKELLFLSIRHYKGEIVHLYSLGHYEMRVQ